MQDVIALDRLRLSPHRNGGATPKDTPELRRRIQDHGFVEPVVVRPLSGTPKRYEILSNAEAYLAAGKLGIHKIPVVVRDDLDDDEAAEIVRSHYQATKANPIAEAEWYAERLDEDAAVSGGKSNIARLARLTGKSRSYISRSLALLKLPPEVQEYFRQGRLSAAHGRCLCKLERSSEQKHLARRAVRDALSVRALESLVNKRSTDTADTPPTPKPAKKDPDTLRLERELSEHVGCPVTIDHATGALTIRYFGNFETLDGVLSKLGYKPE